MNTTTTMTAAEARAKFIAWLPGNRQTNCVENAELRQLYWTEWLQERGLDLALELDAAALIQELEDAYWIDRTNLTRDELVVRVGEDLVAKLEHFPTRVYDGGWTENRVAHTAELPVVLEGGGRFLLSYSYSADRAAYEAADDLSELPWRDDAYGFASRAGKVQA